MRKLRKAGCLLLALLLTASGAWAEGIPSLAERARQNAWNEAAQQTAAPSLADRARMAGQDKMMPTEEPVLPEATESVETAGRAMQTGDENWVLWAEAQESSSDSETIELQKVILDNLRVTVDDEELALPEGLSLQLAGSWAAPLQQLAASIELSDGDRKTGFNVAFDGERSVVYANALARPVVVEPLTAESFLQPFLVFLEGALAQSVSADKRETLHELFDAYSEMLQKQESKGTDGESGQLLWDGWHFGDNVEEKKYDSYEFRYGGSLTAVSAEAQVPEQVLETINQMVAQDECKTERIRFSRALRKLFDMEEDGWMLEEPIQFANISVRRTYGYLFNTPVSTSDYPSTDEMVIELMDVDGGRMECGLYLLRQTEETSIGDVDCSYVAADGTEKWKLRIWLSEDGIENPRIRGTISMKQGDVETLGSIEAGLETDLMNYAEHVGSPDSEAYGVMIWLGTQTQGGGFSCFRSDARQWGWFHYELMGYKFMANWENDNNTGVKKISLTCGQGEHRTQFSADVHQVEPQLLNRADWERMMAARGMSLWAINEEQVERIWREIKEVSGFRN